jgi:hypothetical protein
LYTVQTLTLRKVDQKCLNSLDVWCWRRMEKISYTGRVKIKVLHTMKVESNILNARKRRKANYNGPILRWNCLLNHIIEGDTEIRNRGRRRRRK